MELPFSRRVLAGQELDDILCGSSRKLLGGHQGEKETWELSFPQILLAFIRFVPIRLSEVCKAPVNRTHVHIGVGSSLFYTWSRTTGLAEIGVVIVWVQTGRTSSDRPPWTFNLGRKGTVYPGQIQREAHRSHGRGLAVKTGEEREGNTWRNTTEGSPFLPRTKESTAKAWRIAHQCDADENEGQ